MECKHISDKLHEYIFSELDENTCKGIKEHIDSCEKCRAEHDKMRKLLINDAAPLTEFKNSIEIPDDLMLKARKTVGKRVRFKALKYIAAACMIFVLCFTGPVFAYYAAQIFPFEKYIGFLEKDMIKNFEEGRGQVIGKSSTMNGVTFTVDGMVKKDDKYNILFTIKVPKTFEYNYGMPPTGGNIITVQDQFGRKYRVGGASGSGERALREGEFQYIFEIDEPFSFWSYKLNVRLTAIELGYINGDENKYFVKHKNIYGDWNVSFYINRSLEGR